MKKQYLISALLILFSLAVYSQEDRNGYIGISVGSSTPGADFASTDIDNESAGFASTGILMELNYSHKISSKFGATAILRGQFNSVDAEAFANVLHDSDPTTTWTVSSSAYRIGGFMGGVYASLPLGKAAKFYFEPRLMIGFLNAHSPAITVTGDDGSGSYWYKTQEASATAFSYLLGMDFRFNAGEKIALLLNLDYLGANPEFKNVQSVDSTGDTSKDTFSQQFTTYNFTFGVAYRLK